MASGIVYCIPYGLNDNIKGEGNASSKNDDGLIVYTFFNKSDRKYRKCKPQRTRRKMVAEEVSLETKSIVMEYKNLNFNFRLTAYFIGLPKHKIKIAVNAVKALVLDEHNPSHILLLITDSMTYRFRLTTTPRSVKEDAQKYYMNILFHSKGMDMIDLLRVMEAVPAYIRDPPPIVSYRI